MQLAQQGYPKAPLKYNNSQVFSNKYWHAVGGTDKIKQIIEYLESQDKLVKTITEKYENRKGFSLENQA